MTTIVLNTNIGEVENKITCDNVLVEKTNYLTLSQNIRTTSNCNKFTGKILDPKSKKKEIFDKSDIYGLIYNSDLDKKIATLATKLKLKAKPEKIVKYQTFDSSYFHSISHFEDDGMQNYLVFQPFYKYLKKIANNDHIPEWKSKASSHGSIIPPATSGIVLLQRSIIFSLNYE